VDICVMEVRIIVLAVSVAVSSTELVGDAELP
jgi:hypothetical protein